MAGPRHIYKFVSSDGLTTATFPLARAEFESDQELRSALATAVGMDYAVDLHGSGRAPLDVATERARALLTGDDAADLDATADALTSAVLEIGRGQLWSIGADGTERWAWARATHVPRPVVTYRSLRSAALTLEFVRLSDWYGATKTTITATLDSASEIVAITNPGNADARAITFLLEANAASGFATPAFSHPLTGESWSSTRTAANGNHALRVDTGRYTVERTTDNGATWTDDYAAFSAGAVQVGFMRFLPGTQSITITGCPNAALTIEFWPVYR